MNEFAVANAFASWRWKNSQLQIETLSIVANAFASLQIKILKSTFQISKTQIESWIDACS